MRQRIVNSARVAAVLAIGLSVVGVQPMFADDDNSRNQKENGAAEESIGDSTHTNGQVLQINTLSDPQEIVLANVDGRVVVKMSGKNAKNMIKESGIHVGEYIEVWGQKQSELEFWADTIDPYDDDDD